MVIPMQHEPPEVILADYAEAFRRTYKEVRASISRRVPDPGAAFQLLEDLDKQVLAVHNREMSLMKAHEIVRSNEQEPGSLAELGRRHNRSKARIDQYLDLAEAAEKEESCPS